jgi:plastocyanin
MLRVILVAIAGLVAGPALSIGRAADIDGTVVIKCKLTKRKVTASSGSYDRGVAVPLGSAEPDDPLAFERNHVVIYLEGDLPSKPMTAVMEQKSRQFVPDLVVISAGSTISFPNLDPIFHNVFSLSKPKEFDLGNYPKDHTRTVVFPKPGIVFVNCHLHPNMTATVVVTPNQWNTKPDGSGKFTLPKVVPGTYTVVAWHKSAGFFRQKVTVSESRGATLQFLIPVDENGVAVSRR